jgi:hypothetical protein
MREGFKSVDSEAALALCRLSFGIYERFTYYILLLASVRIVEAMSPLTFAIAWL